MRVQTCNSAKMRSVFEAVLISQKIERRAATTIWYLPGPETATSLSIAIDHGVRGQSSIVVAA